MSTSLVPGGDAIYDLPLNWHGINVLLSEQMNDGVEEEQAILSAPPGNALMSKNQAKQEFQGDQQEQVIHMPEASQEETEVLRSTLSNCSSEESIDDLLEVIAGVDFEESVEEMDSTSFDNPIFDITRVYYSLATKPKLLPSEEDRLAAILELAEHDEELAAFIDKIDREIAKELGLMTEKEFTPEFPLDQQGVI